VFRRGAGTARPAVVVAATLLLFLVWGNTFLAFEYLLAPASGPASMAWLDLLVARFGCVALATLRRRRAGR
jgi:hypothetical protein